MTSKERINNATRGLKPDRCPLMCQIALGHIYKQVGKDPINYWLTCEGFSQGYIDIALKYHFDGILVNLWHGIPETNRDTVKNLRKTNEGHIADTLDGNQMLFPIDDDPRLVKQPKPTIKWIDEINIDDIIVSKLPEYFGNTLDYVIKNAPKDLAIHGEVGTTFEEFLMLFGPWEYGLMALLDDPQKSKDIMKVQNELTIMRAINQCEKGIDAFKLSSPFAGSGFISRDMYEEFVLPYERDLISAVHKYNIPCYIHTCGSIGDRIDLMIETGTDGLECLDPPPIGTVNLEEAVEKYGDKLFFKGNIDSMNELTGVTPSEVKEICKKRIITGQKAKGYILSTACSISPKVEPENIYAMYDAVCETEI